MPTYLTYHSKAGWKFQRWIPKDLRPMLGNRTLLVRYIPNMPRREAEARARAYATGDDQLWARLRSLTKEERTHIIKIGGVEKLPKSIEQHQADIATADHLRKWSLELDPREFAKAVTTETPDLYGMALDKLVETKEELLRPGTLETEAIERLPVAQSIAIKTDLTPNPYALDELLNVWIKANEAKNPRKHRATLQVLKSVIGDIPFNEITQTHIAEFRNHMQTTGNLKATQITYLSHLKSMFNAAYSENLIETNPAEGVKVRGKKENGGANPDRPFTGAEVRLILEKAAEIRFGDSGKKQRHEETLWALKLLAYTGARPNEILQLRKSDVLVDAGVPFIWIRKTHDEQSLKTDQRRVPLHPVVQGFVQFADSRDDFVFSSFTWNKDNGRAAWLISRFGSFLRNDCKIDVPDKTLYSLRHAFHDAMRQAGISDDAQRAIVGHTGDIHTRYGRGSLKRLAHEIKKVDPLAD